MNIAPILAVICIIFALILLYFRVGGYPLQVTKNGYQWQWRKRMHSAEQKSFIMMCFTAFSVASIIFSNIVIYIGIA